jgi:hypothetical protein
MVRPRRTSSRYAPSRVFSSRAPTVFATGCLSCGHCDYNGAVCQQGGVRGRRRERGVRMAWHRLRPAMIAASVAHG